MQHTEPWFILVCFIERRWGVTAIFQTSALNQLLISKAESCDQGRASGEGEVKNWELKRILSVNFR